MTVFVSLIFDKDSRLHGCWFQEQSTFYYLISYLVSPSSSPIVSGENLQFALSFRTSEFQFSPLLVSERSGFWDTLRGQTGHTAATLYISLSSFPLCPYPLLSYFYVVYFCRIKANIVWLSVFGGTNIVSIFPWHAFMVFGASGASKSPPKYWVMSHHNPKVTYSQDIC
jgi:hypothetical protein